MSRPALCRTNETESMTIVDRKLSDHFRRTSDNPVDRLRSKRYRPRLRPRVMCLSRGHRSLPRENVHEIRVKKRPPGRRIRLVFSERRRPLSSLVTNVFFSGLRRRLRQTTLPLGVSTANLVRKLYRFLTTDIPKRRFAEKPGFSIRLSVLQTCSFRRG